MDDKDVPHSNSTNFIEELVKLAAIHQFLLNKLIKIQAKLDCLEKEQRNQNERPNN